MAPAAGAPDGDCERGADNARSARLQELWEHHSQAEAERIVATGFTADWMALAVAYIE